MMLFIAVALAVSISVTGQNVYVDAKLSSPDSTSLDLQMPKSEI